MRRLLVCLVALLAVVAVACGSLQSYALIVNGHRLPMIEFSLTWPAEHKAPPAK